MNYTEFVTSISSCKGTNYSRRDFCELARAMFNNSVEIPVYKKDGEGFTVKMVTPANDIRKNIFQPLLKDFGIDPSESNGRVANTEITVAGAEALADFSQLLIKEYITSVGRKWTLPMTSATETNCSIGIAPVAAVNRNTTMIVKDANGEYKSQPTGKNVAVAEHRKLVVKNDVPVWLKTTTDVK